MSYTKITQEEAKKLMDERDDILIVDVRNPEEYAQGHIPGAINVPNPSITNREIPELPDKNQELLIYCRSVKISKILAVLWNGNMRWNNHRRKGGHYRYFGTAVSTFSVFPLLFCTEAGGPEWFPSPLLS